jgi:putative transposase
MPSNTLCGAILVEPSGEWIVERARYMTLEIVAQLSDDPFVTLSPMAA